MENSMKGLARAAVYAIEPNKAKRCGPEDAHLILWQYAQDPTTHAEAEIRKILKEFLVLAPWLAVIARANKIEDIFNDRVVEAYWLGNELLENVTVNTVRETIKKDVAREGWNAAQSILTLGGIRFQNARAFHFFSVLYFFAFHPKHPKFTEWIKERLDNCRINLGHVSEIEEEKIMVSYQPLRFKSDKHIELGPAQEEWIERGSLGSVEPGDEVSFHLKRGVEKLTPKQVRNLRHYTALTLQALKERYAA